MPFNFSLICLRQLMIYITLYLNDQKQEEGPVFADPSVFFLEICREKLLLDLIITRCTSL